MEEESPPRVPHRHLKVLNSKGGHFKVLKEGHRRLKELRRERKRVRALKERSNCMRVPNGG